MTVIANSVALALAAADQAVVVDVREPAEFRDGHLPGAVNLPSTQFDVEAYRAFDNRAICLICQTGNRAGRIAAQLREQGVDNVFLLERQMESLSDAQFFVARSGGWSIDRQFRMTLGVLLLLFLLGHFLGFAWTIVIPVILGVGLTITALIDRCYLRIGIAMLPWNRSRRDEVLERNDSRTTRPGALSSVGCAESHSS